MFEPYIPILYSYWQSTSTISNNTKKEHNIPVYFIDRLLFVICSIEYNIHSHRYARS